MEQSKEQTLRVMKILDKYEGTLEEKFEKADPEISELARQIGRELKGDTPKAASTENPEVTGQQDEDAETYLYHLLCNKFARGNFDSMSVQELQALRSVWPDSVEVRDLESFKQVMELARAR